MRWVMVAVLIVVLLGLAVPGKAQTEWYYEIDFTLTDGGFVPLNEGIPDQQRGEWVDGEGWHGIYTNDSGSFRRQVFITGGFDPIYITRIHVWKYISQELEIDGGARIFADLGATTVASTSGGIDPPGEDVVQELIVNDTINQVRTDLYTGAGNNSTELYIRKIRLYGEGDNPFESLYKPLASIDSEWGIFDTATFPYMTPNPSYDPTEENLVIAASVEAGDLVYAVAGGEVLSVEALYDDECDDIGLHNINSWRCSLRVDLGDDPLIYELSASVLYRVEVEFLPGYRIEYIVADAPRYVSAGIDITAGCILGRTTNLTPYRPTGISDITPPTTKGVAFVSLRDNTADFQPLLAQLTKDVIPGNACNADPNYAACIGDATLTHPEQWTVQGTVQWVPGGGAILQRNATIRMDALNLNPALAYSMKVQIRRIGSAGNVSLRLGTTSRASLVLTYTLDEYEIPAAIHLADQSPLYSAAVTNTGQEPFEVLSVCITDGTPTTAPNTCYFNNFSFDEGVSEWTLGGTVTAGNLGGEIVMADDATISQNARLYPDGADAHEYEVYVKAQLQGGSEADMTSTASFEYKYPSTGSFVALEDPASGTEYPFGQFFSWPNKEVLFTILVPVSALTNSAFTIKFVEDRAVGATGVITVKEVCINDPFTHHPPGGGGVLPPFRPVCSRISVPAETDIGAWIFYLWAQLDRFFQCDLMTLLNRIWNTAYEAHRFITWQGLYWQAALGVTTQWVGKEFTPWLGGHLNNIGYGRVTTIIQTSGPEGCNNVFCMIQAIAEHVVGPLIGLGNSIISTINNLGGGILDLLNSAVTLLGTLLSGIFNIAFLLIDQLFTVYAQFSAFFGTLVNAYNNAPATSIPGLPTCAYDPRGTAMCTTFWIMEHTIFAGRGALIIPLLLGIKSIHLALWAISEFKRQLLEAARSA